MTAIFIAAGDGFAVVAADTLVRSVAEQPATYHTKISLHASLPVAVASSGIGSLVHPRHLLRLPPEGEVDDFDFTTAQVVIAEALESYGGTSERSAAGVAAHLAHDLRPSFEPLVRFKQFPRDDNGVVTL